MKKIFNIIITILLSIVSIFTIYLVYECIRLYANYGANPLIIRSENVYLSTKNDGEKERNKKIDSLGFNIIYDLETTHENESNMKYIVKNETFKLFDKIEIWTNKK